MGADDDDTDGPRPDTCQYRGYRNGPEGPDRYELNSQYWHVFAARLAFVVIFEHIVFALTGIMQYAIPNVPSEVDFDLEKIKKRKILLQFQLRTQMQREALLAKEAKYEHGLKKNEYDYEDIISGIRENNNGSRNERSVGKISERNLNLRWKNINRMSY